MYIYIYREDALITLAECNKRFRFALGYSTVCNFMVNWSYGRWLLVLLRELEITTIRFRLCTGYYHTGLISRKNKMYCIRVWFDWKGKNITSLRLRLDQIRFFFWDEKFKQILFSCNEILVSNIFIYLEYYFFIQIFEEKFISYLRFYLSISRNLFFPILLFDTMKYWR